MSKIISNLEGESDIKQLSIPDMMLDIHSILFNIDIPPRTYPERGSLLVSEPFMRDQYFGHSVIELIDYEVSKPSMGIVLNRLTPHSLPSLVKGVTDDNPVPIFCGGPMSCDRLYFLHNLGDMIPESREINNGLYIGGRFDTIIDYINSGCQTEGRVRFFIGYSGWDSGQLEDEMSKNVWAVTSGTNAEDLLRGEEDSYWHRTVKRMGKPYRGWLYHPQNIRAN